MKIHTSIRRPPLSTAIVVVVILDALAYSAYQTKQWSDLQNLGLTHLFVGWLIFVGIDTVALILSLMGSWFVLTFFGYFVFGLFREKEEPYSNKSAPSHSSGAKPPYGFMESQDRE